MAGFNYREPGMYFVTPCAHLRQTRFGVVRAGTMHPSPIGQMVGTVWQEIPGSFPKVTLDSWVLMPNHFHGLLLLDADDIETNPTLGDVMKWFKAITTNRYIHGVRDHGWPRFDGHLWQRNYYDHIVRNDADLDRVRRYIQNNPETWEADQLYQVDSGNRWDHMGEVQGQHGG
ncbi:MAG: transposase [Chloroflexota bacterium]|nr:transposase [Chloroflexota bacterium]